MRVLPAETVVGAVLDNGRIGRKRAEPPVMGPGKCHLIRAQVSLGFFDDINIPEHALQEPSTLYVSHTAATLPLFRSAAQTWQA